MLLRDISSTSLRTLVEMGLNLRAASVALYFLRKRYVCVEAYLGQACVVRHSFGDSESLCVDFSDSASA